MKKVGNNLDVIPVKVACYDVPLPTKSGVYVVNGMEFADEKEYNDIRKLTES